MTEEESEESRMTAEEFTRAVERTVYPYYMACRSINAAEADRLLDFIRTKREDGFSFCGFGPMTHDVKSDEEEIAAAAASLKISLKSVSIAGYHRQLSREDAIYILNGHIALARQPGAHLLGQDSFIHALPGYTSNVYSFASDWNDANPDQKPIVPPGIVPEEDLW